MRAWRLWCRLPDEADPSGIRTPEVLAGNLEVMCGDALSASLGLSAAVVGERRKASPAPAPLAGVVGEIGQGGHHELLLRLDEPTTGIAHVAGLGMGGQVCLAIRLYLYGDDAESAARRDEPVWQAWMKERFPAGSDSSAAGPC